MPSNFAEAAYQSALRMKANGDANGGPSAHTPLSGGRTLGYNIAYYYDPLIGTYAPPVGGYVGNYSYSYMPGCNYQYLPMGAWVYDGGTDYYVWGRKWGTSGGTQGLPLTSLRAFADGLGCGSSPGLFSSGGGYGGYGGDPCGYCC